MTYTRWRRQIALAESKALRHLYRAHGHLPACTATSVRYRDYCGHVGGSAPSDDIDCGTERGYKRHRRRQEQACAWCKKAHSEYVLEQRKKRKEAVA